MTLAIAGAIKHTSVWRKGCEVAERGKPFNSNPYFGACRTRGVLLVAIWQAGWQAGWQPAQRDLRK